MEQTYENYEDCALCGGLGELGDDICSECSGSGIVGPHHQYEPREDTYKELES
jgi:DnaJ-class molecular chaperone